MVEIVTKDSFTYPFKGAFQFKEEPETDYFNDVELENAHQVLMAEVE